MHKRENVIMVLFISLYGMDTLIIYTSIHHGNTKKIAQAMAEVLDADLRRPNEMVLDEMHDYDLLGFGSGIYFWKHHKNILALADQLYNPNGQSAFIFSTRGSFPMWVGHRALKKKLWKKGFDVLGEFSCKGYDTYGLLKLAGGINKSRPSQEDMKDARRFAEGLI